MKNKMFLLGIGILIFVIGVTGPRLADANDTGGKEDRLTGILLSTEPPDRLDFSNVRMQPGQMGGDVSLSDVGRQKIYAVEERNEQGRHYTFPGITGSHVIFVREEKPDGEISVYLDQTPGIYTFLHYDDKGKTGDVKLEAKVHMSTKDEIILYPCLLYREANGAVYTLGSEPSWLIHDKSLGHQLTLTFDESYTINQNGAEENDSIQIELALYAELPPKEFTFIEMNKQHNIVQEHSYKPQELPENFSPVADCAYLIVETQNTDEEGKPVTERTMLNQNDESLTVYTCETEFCQQHTVLLHWR